MKLKDKLNRSEVKYYILQAERLKRQFKEGEFHFYELALVDLFLRLAIDAPDACEEVESPYGKIKLASEEAVSAFLKENNISTISEEIQFVNKILEDNPGFFSYLKVDLIDSSSTFGGG